MRRAPTTEPDREDVTPQPPEAQIVRPLPASERLLALQRAAGNQAVMRALLLRAPPDPPAGVTPSLADPLPAGVTTQDPDNARVEQPKAPADGQPAEKLPGGWTDQGGGEQKSGVVGGVDRILLEGMPGNQRQQAEGQPGAPAHDKRYSDTAGTGPGKRGRAIALIPQSVKKGKGGDIAVLVHLHGIHEALRGNDDQPRDVKHYQIEQQLEAFLGSRPGTQMIALLPIGVQIGDDKHSVSFGDLNVDELIKTAFAQLGGELPSGAKPGDVVMSAHSGGGIPLGAMLSSGQGLPAKLAGVFLFEAFHGDVANHIKFITDRMSQDLNVLALTRQSGKDSNFAEEEIFAAQARYLEAGMRVMAFGGYGGDEGYAGIVKQIRAAILQWWQTNSAKIMAATNKRSELIDALWMHYQAQTITSNHENALAGAKENLGRALATLPKDVGVTPAQQPVLSRDFKKQTYTLSDTPVPVVRESKKKKQATIEEAPADYANAILTNAGFTPADWFASFTTISFLGQSLRDPIHTDLAKHLQTVEKTFATKYGGGDAAKAGEVLGLKESIIGARDHPTSAAISMHLFGLAIDVNYDTNPFISATANPVFTNAAALLGRTTTGYADNMSYDDLSTLDTLIEDYFKLLKDDAGLEAALKTAGKPFTGLDMAAARKLIQKDLDDVTSRWERKDVAKKAKIEAGGFLDMDKRLVDEIGLDWGGKTYGDMMHFDMRNRGNGAKIYAAGVAYKRTKEAEAEEKWTKDHPPAAKP